MDPRRFREVLEHNRGPSDENPLAGVLVADLGLATALGAGEPQALRHFERAILPDVRPAVARIDASPAFVDEVVQTLREKLLVGPNGGDGKIDSYSGRAPLVVWARVAAVRTALSLRRATRRHDDDEALAATRAAGPDPELALLKQKSRAAFTRAFKEALTELGPRSRTLLRLAHIDGLTVDQIGAIYKVHRATAARWIAAARAEVASGTLRRLKGRMALGDSEVDSVVRLVQSQLELSVVRYLRSDE